MKKTKHQEGWVKFVRYHCEEGFIDVWTGNGLSNPNLPEPNNISAGIKTYFRLNGIEEWKERIHYFKDDPIGMLNIGSDWNTANEIWNYCKR